MLGVLRIGSGLNLWIPTVAAAACCLILGTILMEPGRLAPGYSGAVAFACDDAAETKPMTPEKQPAVAPAVPQMEADKTPESAAAAGRIGPHGVTAPASAPPSAAAKPAAPAIQAQAGGKPSGPPPTRKQWNIQDKEDGEHRQNAAPSEPAARAAPRKASPASEPANKKAQHRAGGEKGKGRLIRRQHARRGKERQRIGRRPSDGDERSAVGRLGIEGP